MERDLKYALVITAAVFVILIGYGVVAIAN
ncbi:MULTISPECIES: YnhF family membrane protein [Vibrio]|nr:MULTISPECIES: YnhF family membrane protein [Vibrio]NAW68209.1 YnhF family membrane protein [Vibrio sp. V28_P6S34P95]NAX05595.1 YnhF family membrane protein [Vibrio sp. V30_P3S12P165]NAX35527.1 YnhF family membrane protein [Vibrio sp. V29_P1S30P107]NAX38812.1 YnhF family membrane protein [Vibrio sp. V27_P1S3P104]NAX40176.1 YnhF family membrane protein [Vibrio sp. V26_P1S5P106]